MTDVDKAIKILNQGGIGVLATDTIYGLVGSALSPATVERLYVLRQRPPKKPLIILIAALDDLKKFSIKINSQEKIMLNKFWPGAVSVILSCRNKKFNYLHRGTNTLAFRLPASPSLVKILKKTGPLVAPSANLSGQTPATTLAEAKRYFGPTVPLNDPGINFYLAAKRRLSNKPSTLISINRNKVLILRQGALKIKQ